MEGNHTDTKESTGEFYGCLETYARQHLQAWLQDLLARSHRRLGARQARTQAARWRASRGPQWARQAAAVYKSAIHLLKDRQIKVIDVAYGVGYLCMILKKHMA